MRRLLTNPILTTGVAFLLVAIVIWWVGALIDLGGWRPFERDSTRWWTIAALAALWAAIAATIWLVRRRRNRRLVAEVAEPPPRDMAAEAIDEEDEAIRARFAEAMHSLARLRFRNRFGGRRYLYELPWYVFIGPPGSGKTTALRNCGLEFPLARGDDITLEGIAGTRHCEWVFTNDAVFIDTAGRWTTQDSHERVDAAAWKSFLGQLERTRPNEPLNGILVAISVGELAVADGTVVSQQARLIRERLTEVVEALDATIPVYVVFTKCDLLVGFTEFFQSLSAEEREQAWGVTFPLQQGVAADEALRRDLQSVGSEYEALIQRAGEIVLGRMNDERDVGQRARIYEFPVQFSSFKPVVERFLAEAFAPDRFSRPLMLRGFYFTSATQQGQPVDRLIARMSQNFGLGGRVISMLSGSGRSYFLRDLLTGVLFPEAGLVRRQGRRRAVARAGRWAALAGCVLLPVVLGLAWWDVQAHHEAQAAALTGALAAYEEELPLELDPVASEDLVPVLPALDTLGAEVARLDSDEADPPLWGLGIDDTDTLRARAEAAYRHALERLMRPRLLFHLERLMEERLHQQDELYNLLKAYLMLGGRGEQSEAFLSHFIGKLWAEQYGGAENAELLTSLQGHLEALVSRPPPPTLELHEEAIDRAREAVAQTTIAERALLLLQNSEEALALPPWRVTDLGGSVDEVFLYRSGAPLDRPIPGLFTYSGFWTFFIHNVSDAADAALEEKWLVEENAETTAEERAKIRREVMDHYYDAYITAWNELLTDLRFAPIGTPEEAADMLLSLSSNRSPFGLLLQKVADETSLAERPPEDSPLRDKVVSLGQRALFRKLPKGASLGQAAGKEFGAGFDGSEGEPVDRAFDELHAFVGEDGGGSELVEVMDALDGLYRAALDLVEQRGASIGLLSETEAARQLSQAAKRAPRGIEEMLENLRESIVDSTAPGVRASIDSIWKNSVFPECRTTLHGRYPFGGGDEVAVADLEALLGAGGAIDTFFNERLKPMVDTSVSPWAWRPSAGAIEIPPERLGFFEEAARLREAMFSGGQIGLTVQVFPIAIDEQAEVGRFEVGGAAVTFTPEKRDPGQVQWPGPQPANGARVAVVVPQENLFNLESFDDEHSIGEPGLWGLFRLLDKSGMRRRGAGDRWRVRFSVEGYSMLLELRFDSKTNPFALRSQISEFRCPASL